MWDEEAELSHHSASKGADVMQVCVVCCSVSFLQVKKRSHLAFEELDLRLGHCVFDLELEIDAEFQREIKHS